MIIQFTPADVMMNKLVDAGWYGATITKVEGPISPKEGKKGKNFILTFTLDKIGKEIPVYFNDQAMGKFLPVFAATKNMSMEEVAEENNDLDDLKDAKLDVQVSVSVYNGNNRNSIDGYLPYGKSDNEPAF